MKNVFLSNKDIKRKFFIQLQNKKKTLSEMLQYYQSEFCDMNPDIIHEQFMQACDYYYSMTKDQINDCTKEKDDISETNLQYTKEDPMIFVNEKDVKKAFRTYLSKCYFPENIINIYIDVVPNNEIIKNYLKKNTPYTKLYNILDLETIYSLYKYIIIQMEDVNNGFMLSECLCMYYYFLSNKEKYYRTTHTTLSSSDSIAVLVRKNIIKPTVYKVLRANEIHKIKDLTNITGDLSKFIKIDGLSENDFLDIIDNIEAYKLTELQDSKACNLPFNIIEKTIEQNTYIKTRFFDKYYTTRISELSTRAKHIQETHIKDWNVVMKFFDKNHKFFRELTGQNYKTKTEDEITKLVQDCQTIHNKYKDMDDNQVNIDYLMIVCPYLTKNQAKFTSEFEFIHGHKPIFFLTYIYLQNTNDRTERILCKYYGLTNGVRTSIDDISKEEQLTRERLRQIINSSNNFLAEIFTFNDWDKYELTHKEIITQDDVSLKEIIDSENISIDGATIIRYLYLYGKCSIYTLGRTIIGFSNPSELNILLDNIVRQIQQSSPKSFRQEVLIDDYLREVPSNKRSILLPAIKKICKDELNITISQDGDIRYKGYVDVSNILYKILKKKGQPTSAQELFDLFKELEPNHHFTDIQSIKHILYNDNRFNNIGKTSIYSLSEWTNVYLGNIKDLIIETLENTSIPLGIEDIYNAVKSTYKDTNLRSIQSSMSCDNRFVRFEGNKYGLTNKIYDSTIKEANIITRQDFETRFSDYCKFVEENKHLPTNSGNDYECSLRRWCRNVMMERIDATIEQKLKLDDKIKEYKSLDYPSNSTELMFKNNVDQFISFVKTTQRLPSHKNEYSLYIWFYKYQKKYLLLKDIRKKYFQNLLNFLDERNLLQD